MFCYPEHIRAQLRDLFGRLHEQNLLRSPSDAQFAAGAAHFLAELCAIHAFREGNGRTQLAFFAALAAAAGRPIDLRRLDPHRFLAAMIGSFGGSEQALAREIRDLTA